MSESRDERRDRDLGLGSDARAGRDNTLTVAGEFDPLRAETELVLAEGRRIRIPTAQLLRFVAQDGSGAAGSAGDAAGSVLAVGDAPIIDIPIVEERLQVGRRVVATGKVLIEKQVQEYQETLDVPLAVRSFDVERVVINRPVSEAPGVRVEGDTTVYPVVEEQLVLTTQLILKEELRVTKRESERRDTRTVTLKRENLLVTRTDPAGTMEETNKA